MKCKDFFYEGRIVFSKRPLGLGVILEFDPPFTIREKKWTLNIDVLFIRFWIHSYKTKNT
jgi:hypothetical protein